MIRITNTAVRQNTDAFRTEADKPPPRAIEAAESEKAKNIIRHNRHPYVGTPCLLDPSLGAGRNGGLLLPTPAFVVTDEVLLLPLSLVVLVLVLLIPFPVRAGLARITADNCTRHR